MSDVVTATLDLLRLHTAPDDESEWSLQALIDQFGWTAVCESIFAALESNEEAIWRVAAVAVWEAVLDKREMDSDRAIALVYFRLYKPGGIVKLDAREHDNNLAWSIAAKLKGVGYLSSYNPLLDPPIKEQLERLWAR